MKSLTVNIPVDQMPDYREMGAAPHDHSYDIIVTADVNFKTLEITGNIHMYDTAYQIGYPYSLLTNRDKLVLIEALNEEIISQAGEVLDSVKENDMGATDENS